MELNNLELWQYAGLGLGGAFVVLAALAANIRALTSVVKQGKLLYATVKTNKEAIYNAVNDPKDTVPTQIAALTPWKDTPEMWSSLLEALVRTTLHYTPPPQEVNLGEPSDQ